jgi:hypothetical protein
MATREELEILLRDSITPGLRSIARELRALNRVAKESGDESAGHIDKTSKSFGGLADSSSTALRSMTAMGSYVIGFGKAVLGIGGAIESIKRLSEGLNEFATNRVQLSMFAQDTKFATDDIGEMRGAMLRMGVEAKTADTYIANLSTKLQELRAFREGSTLFQDLEKMGSVGNELGKKLLGDVKVDDYKKALDDILDFYKTQGPEVQFYISQTLGIPQSVLQNLQQYRELVEDTFEGDEEAAKKYVANRALFFERLESEWNRFASHALDSINKVSDGLAKDTEDKRWLSTFFIEGWDQFTKTLEQDKKDITDIIDLVSKTSAQAKSAWDKMHPDEVKKSLQESVGKVTEAPQTGPKEAADRLRDAFAKVAGGGATFQERFSVLDELKLQQEDTKLLTDIRDSLMRMEEQQMGTLRPGVGGGVGGPGVYGQGARGGALPAGIGGFRPGVRGRTAGGFIGTEEENQPGGGGVIDRARFAKELENNPALKAKIMGIMAGEQGEHPEGTAAIFETMMNRAAMTHTTLAYQARTTGEGGYYAGYKPNALDDPKWRAVLEQSYKNALGGSNYSNYATDNASGPFADREAADGSFIVQRKIHGETLFSPGNRDSGGGRNRRNYDAWRKRVDDDQKDNVFNKGTASVTVDFGSSTSAKARDANPSAPVFKDLKVGREPQAPKSGDPADFNSRWYFQ